MSQYQTGTVSVEVSSASVTGSGTVWLTNCSAGDAFKIKDLDPIYQVASVLSDTLLTLTSPYYGSTATGQAYQIGRDFTNNFNFQEVYAGDKDWPQHMTVNFIRVLDELLGERIQGLATVSISTSGDFELNSYEYSYGIIELNGVLVGDTNVIIPLLPRRQYTINNKTTGAYNLQVIGESGTGVTIASGKCAIVYSDGTNFVRVTPDT